MDLVKREFDYRDKLLKKYKYKTYKEYLKSPEWLSVKNWVETRTKIRWHRCRICHSTKDLHIHHKRYYIIGTGIKKLGEKTIVILCKDCHSKIHWFARNFNYSLDGVIYKYKRIFWGIDKPINKKYIKKRIKYLPIKLQEFAFQSQFIIKLSKGYSHQKATVSANRELEKEVLTIRQWQIKISNWENQAKNLLKSYQQK